MRPPLALLIATFVLSSSASFAQELDIAIETHKEATKNAENVMIGGFQKLILQAIEDGDTKR